ncbi:unnamed protein product [Ambrosiozyma monospora]|uniref:Unnamed protein product n=1 Tax=Ambrosiozyma monospora TaxID=43982 RepID=A0ACB5SU35_AMBMO|nr:unnamed protein product [Ambrosiozyma monospora]
MPPVDPSAGKCYDLELPNLESSDDRFKLTVRTGASTVLEKSKIFVYGGLVTPLRLSPEFTTLEIKTKMSEFVSNLPAQKRKSNPLDYISNECFALGLIKRKWSHLKIDPSCTQRPKPRFFHAMLVYDSFVYISGGLTFKDSEFNLKVLNDTWQYDLITKKWKCILPEDNDLCDCRYNHHLVATPSLIITQKLNHHGILFIGGMNQHDEYCKQLNVFDLCDLKWVSVPLEFINTVKLVDGVPVKDDYDPKTRASLGDVTLYQSSDLLSLVLYTQPENIRVEPLVAFQSIRGERLSSNRAFIKDEKDLGNFPYKLYYPTVGFFGDNIIVCGFVPGELSISAYVLNGTSGRWVRLQVYCGHNVWSHRFWKGFVWNSHHKALFLGNKDTSSTPPTMQYFNIYVSVSLPFTNMIGSDLTYKAPIGASDASGPFGRAIGGNNIPATLPKTFNLNRGGSFSSTVSVPDHQTLSDSQTQPTQQLHQNEPHTSFAAYAHYVAPQIQINSISSVFPSYAVALGKNAFERTTAFSDFELISCEGDSIKLPLDLCRFRWGKAFDELVSKAYAMTFLDQELDNGSQSGIGADVDDLATRHNSSALDSKLGGIGSATDSGNGNDGGSIRKTTSLYSATNNSSHNSNREESPPLFRYPFQDKSSSKESQLVSSSNTNTSSRLIGSPSLNISRRQSRVDSTISLSGRSSFNYPSQSRQNSMATTSVSSRRSSLRSNFTGTGTGGGRGSFSQPTSRHGSIFKIQGGSGSGTGTGGSSGGNNNGALLATSPLPPSRLSAFTSSGSSYGYVSNSIANSNSLPAPNSGSGAEFDYPTISRVNAEPNLSSISSVDTAVPDPKGCIYVSELPDQPPMPNIELSKDIVGVSIGTGVGKLSTVPSADSLPTVSTPDSSNSGTQSSSTPASGSAGSISAPNQLAVG